MKPVSFSQFKRVRAMTLNEFNRWLTFELYQTAVQEAYEIQQRDVIAEIGEEDLMEAILSVKGIGEKRAEQIIKAIIERGNK